MTLAKRGLGRGLEALLVEVPVMAEASLHSQGLEQQRDGQNTPFVSADLPYSHDKPESRQTVRSVLLKEAEDLKSFLDEFETMVQDHSL